MRLLITCLLLLTVSANFAAQRDKPKPTPGVTYENFLLLKSGMKYPDVVKLLGKEGVEVARGEAGNLMTGKQKMVTYFTTHIAGQVESRCR